MRQEMIGFGDGSGISWTICKQSAPHSRQITTPAPTTQFFTGRMPFLPPNQQRQSTEGVIDSSQPVFILLMFTLRDSRPLSPPFLPSTPLEVKFAPF